MRAFSMLLLAAMVTSPAYALDNSMVQPPNMARPDAGFACIALEHDMSQVGKVRLVQMDQLPKAVLEHAVLKKCKAALFAKLYMGVRPTG